MVRLRFKCVEGKEPQTQISYATSDPSFWVVLGINNINPPNDNITHTHHHPSPISPVLRHLKDGDNIFCSVLLPRLWRVPSRMGAAELSFVLLIWESAGESCSDWQKAVFGKPWRQTGIPVFELKSAILLLPNLQAGRGRCGCSKQHVYMY